MQVPKTWEEIWSILERHGEKLYLYAVVDKKTSLVKFGRSVAPGQRLKGLQTANGNKLKLWAYCPYELPFTEPYVHKYLSDHQQAGEWFSLNETSNEVIDMMRRYAGV